MSELEQRMMADLNKIRQEKTDFVSVRIPQLQAEVNTAIAVFDARIATIEGYLRKEEVIKATDKQE
jgi:C4-type Zn-finger protein